MIVKVRMTLRRFEQRWLRPLFRRLKKARPLRQPPATETDASQELLVAVLRLQIRQGRVQPNAWEAAMANFRDIDNRKQVLSLDDMNSLMESLLASDSHRSATLEKAA